MKDRANARLRALRGSMTEALGKVAGIDALEAHGAREKAAGKKAARKKSSAGADDKPKRSDPSD